MRSLLALFVVLLFGVVHPADASVVLRVDGHAWKGWPENDPPMFSFTGRVVISDAAFAAGSYSLIYHNLSGDGPGLIEQNGVEDFSFDTLTFASLIGHNAWVEIWGGTNGTKFPYVYVSDEYSSFDLSMIYTDYGLYGCRDAGACVVADSVWSIERGPSVPEPASVALLSAGALLLAACRRSRAPLA